MTEYQVKLNSIEKVVKFVDIVGAKDNRYEFISDNYVIDAKSILGIFSLDLTKPLNLRVHNGRLPMELNVFLK